MNTKRSILFLCSTIPLLSQAANSGESRPNVILILADDQGYGDLSCHGNPIIKTPNIDKFYSEAVRFTDFHVSPTSAPSRSGLMTGRNPDKVGVWHTIGGRSILFEDETVMPQVLNKAGYVSGIFGKWHLGDNYPSRPEDKGFTESVIHGGGGISQGPDYWGNDYFSDHYRHNGKYEQYEGYCTDVFFSEAIKFIEANKDEPFFCYLPINAPHTPLHVPSKYLDIYRNNPALLPDQQRFYGMITNIDDNFAILRKRLKQLKLDKNTILIFMTDNGTASGYSVVDGKEYGYSANMRGTKAMAYEGGHRVPFFISYPNGKIGGGRDIDNLTAHIDVLPTIAELCGVEVDGSNKPLDGESLVPLIDGASLKDNNRTIIVDSQRRKNLVKWLGSSVMQNKWRLIKGKELYDLTTDPSQSNDIADQHPAKVAELREDYEAWWNDLVLSGANERYAYIVAGAKENPVRISAHDMQSEDSRAHHQFGALKANNPLGIYKVEIATDGEYKIELCRYPKESGLKFNTIVEAIEPTDEIPTGQPASNNVVFECAELNIAQFTGQKPVVQNSSSVEFTLDLYAGKYDLEGFFKSKIGVKYPIYYLYITKISGDETTPTQPKRN